MASARHWLRYGLVGAVNAGVSNAALIGADRAAWGTAGALVASFVLTTPIAYMLHSRVTYGAASSWRAFAAFTAGALAGVPLASCTLVGLRAGFHLPMPVAAPLATAIVMAWGYVSARIAILSSWRRRRSEPRGERDVGAPGLEAR